MWTHIKSVSIELLRPAWHWLSRYPLFLIMSGLLLLIAWGKRLQGFDAFYLVWHEDRRPGIAGGAALAIVLGFFWYLTYLIDRARAARPLGPTAGRWWAYLTGWLVTLAAFTLPAALPGEWSSSEAWPDSSDPNDFPSGRFFFPEGVGAVALMLTLVVIAIAALKRPELMKWFGRVLIAAVVLSYTGLSVFHSLRDESFCPIYSTAVNFLLLIGFIGAVYGLLLWAAARWRWADSAVYPATMLLAVAFLPGVRETEHRLPYLDYAAKGGGRKDYYEAPANLFLVKPPTSGERKPDWKPHWDAARHAAEAELRAGKSAGPEAKPVVLIPSNVMLKNWKAKVDALATFKNNPPPAIVLTVSGGASTSALYTACLLFDLEDAYPDFGEQIVLITGASGGMVGAAYYVAQCQPGGLIARLRVLHRQQAANRVTSAEYSKHAQDLRNEYLKGAPEGDQNDSGLHADFLTPVIQKWIAKDAPFNFFQRHTTNDRGRALELAWNRHLKGAINPKTGTWDSDHPTFDVPFRDLAKFEREGIIPSLVFAPMMVEDGRQLLISNLDLDGLIEAEAKPQPFPALAAVEFFKLFRGADQFRLGTAVRMQASFPFISPAATLPTNPIRRVVDAGYYDNYGVNVALKWIDANKDSLRQVTNAVRLITVYTYGYESNMDLWTRPEEDADYQELVDQGRDAVERVGAGAYKSATTPVSGLFSSWKSNMVYRAEDRIGYIAKSLNKPGEKPVFFDRLRIPGPPDPPMNWYLRQRWTWEFEVQFGWALKSMAYLKSPKTTAEQRLAILTGDNRQLAEAAFAVLKDMGTLKAADLQNPRGPLLTRIYESRPIFNQTTEKLADLMAPPKGSNAVPTGAVQTKRGTKK